MEPMNCRIQRPNPRQEEFLRCEKKYIAFGGARGGGKSWAVRTKAKLLALRYAGIRLLLIRRTYQELENNHLRFLRAELRGIAEYHATARQFRFMNGSVLDFGYCACDSDLDRYQGAEYDVIFIDEATQLRPEWLRQFAACLRGVNAFPKRIYYTCNPGGPGHGYIKRLFIDKRYLPGENRDDYAFIPAKVTDNTALLRAQPDYLDQLKALPQQLRLAWLEGRWDIFQGQFFSEFTDDPDHYADRRFTHVIPPFDIPREWRIYRSYDFGYAKPFSCAWWAVDFDGVIYRILELYGCTENPDEGVRWTPERQFRRIREIEENHPWLKGRDIQGVADPAIWDTSRGESIYETALHHRIYFQKGDNRRISGWMQMHYRLSFDDEGYPMMYVFSTCRAFLRTVPLLLYSNTDPEDLDTHQEDHVADECRYFCMSRPIAPVRRSGGALPADDPLDLMKQARR
ncbi:MAG: Terminase-like family protein [Ruminococcaceae bacterium]|nr:Terminase-like family protein [Oscillospiraceae bacterium]